MGLIVILTAATALALLGFISRAQKPKRIGATKPRACGKDWSAMEDGAQSRKDCLNWSGKRSGPLGGETPLVTAPRSSVPSLARAGLAPSPRHHAITGGRNKRCSKSYAKVERSVNWFVCFS